MKDIRTRVKEKYGRLARQVSLGKVACCGAGGCDPITSDLYRAGETKGLPKEALQASLGCGNPVALAELRPGETVLDLGSGGGIDVLLAARRLGPKGKAYGLDMSDDMLELAEKNRAKAGAKNVEFLKGEIEAIPLPDASVDVILSNCVINLSADKPSVFREMFRVLRPGGRVAVHDVVLSGRVPPAISASVEAWIGCIAGALEQKRYQALLRAAGFRKIALETTRVYRMADAMGFLEQLRPEVERKGLSLERLAAAADGKYRSVFIRAVKPTSKA